MNRKLKIMNTNNFFNQKIKAIILILILFLFSQTFMSCNDDEILGDPYFNIEDSPTGLAVDMNENSSSYVVRSNRPWKIVAQEEGDWVRAFPNEGKDDGIFKFIIEENNAFDARLMNFAFIVDGEEQPVLFRVDQEANVPYIIVQNGEAGISVPSVSSSVAITIKANVVWEYTLDDDSWLEEIDVTDTEITFQAARNFGDARTATLAVSSELYPDANQTLILTQSPGYIILEEDFSWLNYGSPIPYVYTPNEVRYDYWTQEEKDRGWVVTPNEFSSYQRCVYARVGFVKIGKTTYGGDMITPALDIVGTVDLKVTFKAAVYVSAGGTIDDNILKVFALNAGTPSVSEFIIDNIPNNEAQDAEGIVNDIWDPARAYNFTITGATSDTKVRFLGGDLNLAGVGKGKNRILFDDVKIEIIQ